MKDTNDMNLDDLDVLDKEEITGKQYSTQKNENVAGKKPETPKWISSCERNGCPMSEMVASEAKKLFEENQLLKKIQEKYEHLRTVSLEGRQILLNEVYIDFDIENKAYNIKFKKKLKMYEDSKKYYTIRLHCDKKPNKKKIEKRSEDVCSFWDDIDLKIKLTDLGSHPSKFVYSYPDYNPGDDEFPLSVTEEDRTANSLIMKVSFCHEKGQPIEFSRLKEGNTEKKYSLIEIEYSFRITTDHWGNYIERHVSFDREETIVYLKKGNYKLPGQSGVRKVSKDEFTDPQVPIAIYEKDEEKVDGYTAYKFRVDNDKLPWDTLSSTNLRVRWDCGSIFGDSSLNDIDDFTPGVATKGMGST